MCACYFVSSGSRELGGSVDLLDIINLGNISIFSVRGHYHPLYLGHNTSGMWWGTQK